MSPQLARALAGQSLIFLLDLGAEWNDALIDEAQSSPAAAPSTEPGAPEGASGGGRQSGGLSGLIGGSPFGSAFGTPKAEAGRLSSRVSTWRTREAEKLAMSLHSHFNFDVCLVVDVRPLLLLFHTRHAA